jgi:hypothetical protein
LKKKKVLSRLCFFLGVVSVLLSFGQRKQAEKKEKYLVFDFLQVLYLNDTLQVFVISGKRVVFIQKTLPHSLLCISDMTCSLMVPGSSLNGMEAPLTFFVATARFLLTHLTYTIFCFQCILLFHQ